MSDAGLTALLAGDAETALTAFAETPADVAIIEVGLGGRYDASNVFDKPAATVICEVDYDHLEMLGPDLGKIAWEKAGILRTGVPGVIARQAEETENQEIDLVALAVAVDRALGGDGVMPGETIDDGKEPDELNAANDG